MEHPEHGVVKIKVDRFIRLKLREINATRDLLRIVPGDFVVTSCKSSIGTSFPICTFTPHLLKCSCAF